MWQGGFWMGAMPGHAGRGAGWPACPCPGGPLCEGMRCLSHPEVKLQQAPGPTAMWTDLPAQHSFLALSGSTAGPGEPPAVDKEPGPSGCHGRCAVTPVS